MAIPIAQILSAAAPLVMSAVEMYRRRNDAPAAIVPADNESLDALHARLQTLEEADLEQSRLIAELARNLEELAKSHAMLLEENRRYNARVRLLTILVVVLGVAGVGLVAWIAAR